MNVETPKEIDPRLCPACLGKGSLVVGREGRKVILESCIGCKATGLSVTYRRIRRCERNYRIALFKGITPLKKADLITPSKMTHDGKTYLEWWEEAKKLYIELGWRPVRQEGEKVD